MPAEESNALRAALPQRSWWIILDGETSYLWTQPSPESAWHLHGVATYRPLTATGLRDVRLGDCPTPAALRGAVTRADPALAAAELTITRRQPDFLDFWAWRRLAEEITRAMVDGKSPAESAAEALSTAALGEADIAGYRQFQQEVPLLDDSEVFAPRGERETAHDYYRRVAAMFRAAEMVEPKAPVRYLAERLGVPFHKAVRHVNEARNRGFLELSDQQRRNRGDFGGETDVDGDGGSL